jgi:putative ABC transport system substrate-binding protein
VVAAFRQGLSEAGFVEGQNVVIEWRWAEGHFDRLPTMAADLVSRKVDVIATDGPSTRAAKEATSTIPTVFSIGGDPVAAGLVASLAQPGGNLTGVTGLTLALYPKRLKLLSELVPRAGVIGLLLNPNNEGVERLMRGMQEAARLKGGAAPNPEGRQRRRDRRRFRRARPEPCRCARRLYGSVLCQPA